MLEVSLLVIVICVRHFASSRTALREEATTARRRVWSLRTEGSRWVAARLARAPHSTTLDRINPKNPLARAFGLGAFGAAAGGGFSCPWSSRNVTSRSRIS
jgi:hypothetical protein